MTTTIYYFSGTGNSMWVAQTLAEQIPEAVALPIPALIHDPVNIPPAEGTIGFVFPVYGGGPPLIVDEFVRMLEPEAADMIFAVVTMASAGEKSTFHRLNRILLEKGKKLDYANAVLMPSNGIILFDVTPKNKIQKVLATANKEVNAIAKDIAGGATGWHTKSNPVFTYFNGLMYPFLRKEFGACDRDFSVTKDCNACGTCVSVCPVDNITLEEGFPVWHHQCQMCLACIHYCPTHAIQYRKKTAKKGRYHHPEIPARVIKEQKSLAVAPEETKNM